jgi:nucleoid-associated protein YgaU
MIGTKAIAIMVAIGVGLLAGLGGIYLYLQGIGPPPSTEQVDTTTPGSQPATPEPTDHPQNAAEPEPPAKLQAEATAHARPEAEPTVVPSFDVVVIQPSGEGVIAGRAAPGWEVSVQSGGTKVAAATADAQGEWSVVLETPLPAGDTSLSLKTTSPDGTRALSSQETVRVAVGKAEQTTAPAPPLAETAKVEALASPAPAQPEAPQALALAEPQGSEHKAKAATEENGREAQPKPTLVFKTVDYEDTGSDTGTVTLTGTSEPGATISIFFDDAPLATVRTERDGKWRIVVEKRLGLGQHNFRAERLDATGALAGRAVVSLERATPTPKAPEVAAKAGAAPSGAKPSGAPSSSSQVAAVGSSGQSQKELYTIRRGDTLWAIAKRYLGSGLRYTTIFQNNRQTINNPDLIHPQQQVTVPAQ